MMCFFFFKQKTAYEMRISDWSSDVCSSDLPGPRVPGAWLCQPGRAAAAAGHARTAGRTRPRLRRRAPAQHLREPGADGTRHPHLTPAPRMLAGKPACISRRMAWTALRIDVDPELRCCCAVGNGLANPSDVYVLGGSRPEEHTYEIQSLMRSTLAVLLLQNTITKQTTN